MSRISTNQIYGINQQNIVSARQRELKSSDRSSSLKAVDRPSDSPSDFVIAENMKDDISIRESIMKNAHFTNSILNLHLYHLQENLNCLVCLDLNKIEV